MQTYSDFEKLVFKEIDKIPYGKTKSYKEIAIAIGIILSKRKGGIVVGIPTIRSKPQGQILEDVRHLGLPKQDLSHVRGSPKQPRTV